MGPTMVQNDECFAYDIAVLLPRSLRHMKDGAVLQQSAMAENDKRQEDKRREQRIEEENRQDSIVLERLLFQRVIDAEEGSGKERKD